MTAKISNGTHVFLSKDITTLTDIPFTGVTYTVGTAGASATLSFAVAATTVAYKAGDLVMVHTNKDLAGSVYTIDADLAVGASAIVVKAREAKSAPTVVTGNLYIVDSVAGDLQDICAATIAVNKEAAQTIAVGTFCDPQATISAPAATAGTVTLTGFMDVTSKEYQVLHDAEVDMHEHMMAIELNQNGSIVSRVKVTSLSWDVPLNGAIGYTAVLTMQSAPVHRF